MESLDRLVVVRQLGQTYAEVAEQDGVTVGLERFLESREAAVDISLGVERQTEVVVGRAEARITFGSPAEGSDSRGPIHLAAGNRAQRVVRRRVPRLVGKRDAKHGLRLGQVVFLYKDDGQIAVGTGPVGLEADRLLESGASARVIAEIPADQTEIVVSLWHCGPQLER